MAKACGLRIGPRRYELVVLEGGPKNPRIVGASSGDLPSIEDDGPEAVAAALKQALKSAGAPHDHVAVAIDARHAAFRKQTLPVTDNSKIEQVLKYEVESQLPQFDIDQVIVDFLPTERASDSVQVLASAVPKEDVGTAIQLASRAGYEPMSVELETTAMINAAMKAGLCGAEAAQVLVHVGDESTAVAVVDGGKVREMRTIHVGALTHTPRPESVEGLSDAEEDGEGDEAAQAERLEEWESPESMLVFDERREEILGRIRRELGRTVSGARTIHELEAVYVCGFELSDLVESEVMGLPVRAFEAYELPDVAPGGYRSAAVAFGAALRELGGAAVPARLRREEHRFTGKLERLELPLAVVCLLILTFLGVYNIFMSQEREKIDEALGLWIESSNNYMVGDPKAGTAGTLVYPSEDVLKYVKKVESEGDPERDQLDQLRWTNTLLRREIDDLSKDLGQDSDITQPQSALKAMTYVLNVFNEQGERTGRPSIRRINASYQPGKMNKPDACRVVLDLAFFAESQTEATKHYENFEEALRAKPWFMAFEGRRNEPLEGGGGIYLQGIAVTVDMSKAEVKG